MKARGSSTCIPRKDSETITSFGERTLLSNPPVPDPKPMGFLLAKPRRPQKNSWSCRGASMSEGNSSCRTQRMPFGGLPHVC